MLGAAVAALTIAASASALPTFGVAEDATKYADDGGRVLFDKLRAVGMVEDRITVPWNPDDPTTIQEKAFLDRSLPVARAKGVQVVLSVYPNKAFNGLGNDASAALFVGYLVKLARTYPYVTQFIVGNEPNERYFWQPQFGLDGAEVAGSDYERVLAAAYDSLKSLNPNIDVIGLGLSPDANDQTSTSPVRFLKAVGDAYRASGRTAPLMDQLGFHIYPKTNVDQPTTHYAWPNAGAADLDRIRQAVWDAFNGTAQPTFREAGQSGGVVLTFKLDEIGWQAAIPADHMAGYQNQENVPTISEATQAQIYSDEIRTLSCDPTVADVLFFHLIDEPDLRGLQSGLLRLDGSERPAYSAVRDAIASAANCGSPHLWVHASGVVGANASFESGAQPASQNVFGLNARADEGADASAGIFKVSNGTSRPNAARIGRSLAGGAGPRPVVVAAATLRAGLSTRFEFDGTLNPGWYVYGVRLSSTVNPSRVTTLVSPAFRVG